MTKKFSDRLPAPPKRKELSSNPIMLCHEISRISRARVRENCDLDGVMSQPGARLVLSLLAVEDGRSQRQIVDESHLRPPTVSVIVKKMAEEGLVELRADEEDLRVIRVYLTSEGRKADREGIERIRAVDAKGLSGLSEEETKSLMSLLGKIRDNLLKDEEEEA